MLVGIIARQRDLHVIGEVRANLAVDRPDVLVLDLAGICEIVGRAGSREAAIGPAERNILAVGAVIVAGCREVRRKTVTHRNIDIDRSLVGLARRRGEPGLRMDFVRRLTGDDVDHAAAGVAAIETALRALQDFDALDVDEIVDKAAVDVRHIVDEGGDRRIGADKHAVTDAADVNLGIAGARLRDEARRSEANGRQILDARSLEHRTGRRADRQRNRHDIFRTALRRDDNVLDANRFIGGGRLILGLSGHGKRQCAGGQQQPRSELVHTPLPKWRLSRKMALFGP